MAETSHHHYVSAGYLRLFAQRSDRNKYFVQQYDKLTDQVQPWLSVRDVLTRSHHNSYLANGVRGHVKVLAGGQEKSSRWWGVDPPGSRPGR